MCAKNAEGISPNFLDHYGRQSGGEMKFIRKRQKGQRLKHCITSSFSIFDAPTK